MEILKVENLVKTYGKGETKINAVDDISFTINKGEFVAIVGASGSGKSTLLHLIGGVDRPTSGKVYIDGKDIYALNNDNLAIFRRRQIGLIYQFYNLIPILNVVENISLPVLLDNKKVDNAYLEELLDLLDLKARKNHLPNELSGGQQQRVAIGRALMARPSILLCDEPTGNLDTKASLEIMNLLKIANTKYNQTIIMITHDMNLTKYANRIIEIKDGKIVLADTFYAVNPYQDFGIIERPRQQFETNKRISNIKVTLANGQVLINGNPYKTIPDAELYDSWNEIEKTADNALPYVKALPSSVLAEIDNELLQGATLEVEYTVSIKNDSELDYEYTTNSDYYYYGTKLPGQELKRVIKKVVDYMDDNLVYDENNNSVAGWNKVTADQLSAWQEGDITKKLVSDEVKADINKGYTISITDQFARNELKAGEATSIKIYGSKLLASNENGIGASNHVEIVETARKIYGATPGNYDPKTATPNKPYESDDDMTRVNITPPTGLTDNRTFIISLAAIVLVVVVGEIYFIKKKVLK